MPITTDSGTGTPQANHDFGQGYHPLWGLILHRETLNKEQSIVDQSFRSRRFTHTLTIQGVLLRSYEIQVGSAEPPILNGKDRLASMFYDTQAIQIAINDGLFPSLPSDDADADWQPVSIDFDPAPWVRELRYTATIAYTRYPKESEIQSISVFGKQFWDGSNIGFRREYDRTTKKITEVTTVSGTIKSPDQMPWSKALFYYDQANSLQVTSITSNADVTGMEVTKNFDQQTISYNISGYNVKDKGDTGASGFINIFGHLWPGTADISIESTPLRDTHLLGVNAIQQNINFNLQINAPEDMTFAEAMTHYQYALSMIPRKMYATFADSYYRFGRAEGWDIDRINPSFNPVRKTVSINISGYRIINRTPIKKNVKVVSNGTAFLWSNSVVTFAYSNEVEGLIFQEQINATGEAQVPQDMTEAEANAIVKDINSLESFDYKKYPAYKLQSKNAHYNNITKQLTYQIQLKKLDFFDPFIQENGTSRFRSANDKDRKVDFSYGVLTGITGLQFDVNIEESYQNDENNNEVRELSVSGRLSTLLDPKTGKVSTAVPVQDVLKQIWTKYVNNKTKLNNGLLKLRNASKRVSTARMEANFSLSFSDFGAGTNGGDGKIGMYFPQEMGSAGLLVIGRFDDEASIMRLGTHSDGFSAGQSYDEQGLGIRTLNFSGIVQPSEFKNNAYKYKWQNIQRRLQQNGNFMTIRGIRGRVTRLSMNGIDLGKKTATVSVTIEAQPNAIEGSDPILVAV